MKILFLFLLLALILCASSYAQSDPLKDPGLCDNIRKTVNYITNKNVNALSRRIQYPIDRDYPLLSIKGPKDLIARFDELFDSIFISKLTLSFSDSTIFERNGNYGLVQGEYGFIGDLWFNYDGMLITVNYMSERAEVERKRLEDSIRLQTHISIRDWRSNQLVASSNKYLIRIDYVGDSLRYASWNKGKTQSDKPDLVIMGGKWEAQGSMGGWTWTFINKGWKYIVDQNNYADSDDRVGLFLIVTKEGNDQYEGKYLYRGRLTELDR